MAPNDEVSSTLRRMEGLLLAQLICTRAQLSDGQVSPEELDRHSMKALNSAGYSQREIATLLNTSQATVSRRLSE